MIVTSAIITILASILLTIFYWRVNKVHVFLLVFMVSLNLFAILHQVLFYKGSVLVATILYNHFAPVFYLPGHMLYFYFRGILEDRDHLQLKYPQDLLHFIPFAVCFIGILPYLFLPFDQKLVIVQTIINDPNQFKTTDVNWILSVWANSLLRPVFLLLYSLVSFNLIRKYQRQFKLRQSQFIQGSLTTRWLYALAAFMASIAVCYIYMVGIYFSTQRIELAESQATVLKMIISVLLVFIPVILVIFPQLLYGIPQPVSHSLQVAGYPQPEDSDAEVLNKATLPLAVDTSTKPDYLARSGLRDPLEQQAAEVLSFVENNKLYLDPDFNLESLAQKMKIPRNHMYYCFNSVINEKFTTYRTRLRVEYAKKLLLDGAAKTLSMDGLATAAGFSSRSRFFVSFREITGLTPMEFLQSHGQSEGVST
jgi:AraC-like DNA-binding protein